jgi:hypothetical protein
MGNVSRPLIGLLVAAVAFFALYIVALKPSSSSTTGGAPTHGLGVYQSAINRAKGVQAVVNRGAAAAGGTAATTASPTVHKTPTVPAAHPSVKAAPTTKVHATSKAKAKPAAHSSPAATPAQRLGVVERALATHKVLAALFYNPAASDDQAVKQELASVPTHSGKVVKLIVPLSELSNYTLITNQVPVSFSPTLVVINRSGQASTIVGFADTFEIDQRIAGAL